MPVLNCDRKMFILFLLIYIFNPTSAQTPAGPDLEASKITRNLQIPICRQAKGCEEQANPFDLMRNDAIAGAKNAPSHKTQDGDVFSDISRKSDVKKISEIHDTGYYTSLCWIEITTITETRNGTKSAVREYAITFETPSDIPHKYLNKELARKIEENVAYRIFDRDTKRSQIVNFTTISKGDDRVVRQHRKILCGSGPVYTKEFMEWSNSDRKRVEIRVSPKKQNLVATDCGLLNSSSEMASTTRGNFDSSDEENPSKKLKSGVASSTSPEVSSEAPDLKDKNETFETFTRVASTKYKETLSTTFAPVLTTNKNFIKKIKDSRKTATQVSETSNTIEEPETTTYRPKYKTLSTSDLITRLNTKTTQIFASRNTKIPNYKKKYLTTTFRPLPKETTDAFEPTTANFELTTINQSGKANLTKPSTLHKQWSINSEKASTPSHSSTDRFPLKSTLRAQQETTPFNFTGIIDKATHKSDSDLNNLDYEVVDSSTPSQLNTIDYANDKKHPLEDLSLILNAEITTKKPKNRPSKKFRARKPLKKPKTFTKRPSENTVPKKVIQHRPPDTITTESDFAIYSTTSVESPTEIPITSSEEELFNSINTSKEELKTTSMGTTAEDVKEETMSTQRNDLSTNVQFRSSSNDRVSTLTPDYTTIINLTTDLTKITNGYSVPEEYQSSTAHPIITKPSSTNQPEKVFITEEQPASTKTIKNLLQNNIKPNLITTLIPPATSTSSTTESYLQKVHKNFTKKNKKVFNQATATPLSTFTSLVREPLKSAELEKITYTAPKDELLSSSTSENLSTIITAAPEVSFDKTTPEKSSEATTVSNLEKFATTNRNLEDITTESNLKEIVPLIVEAAESPQLSTSTSEFSTQPILLDSDTAKNTQGTEFTDVTRATPSSEPSATHDTILNKPTLADERKTVGTPYPNITCNNTKQRVLIKVKILMEHVLEVNDSSREYQQRTPIIGVEKSTDFEIGPKLNLPLVPDEKLNKGWQKFLDDVALNFLSFNKDSLTNFTDLTGRKLNLTVPGYQFNEKEVNPKETRRLQQIADSLIRCRNRLSKRPKQNRRFKIDHRVNADRPYQTSNGRRSKLPQSRKFYNFLHGIDLNKTRFKNVPYMVKRIKTISPAFRKLSDESQSDIYPFRNLDSITTRFPLLLYNKENQEKASFDYEIEPKSGLPLYNSFPKILVNLLPNYDNYLTQLKTTPDNTEVVARNYEENNRKNDDHNFSWERFLRHFKENMSSGNGEQEFLKDESSSYNVLGSLLNKLNSFLNLLSH